MAVGAALLLSIATFVVFAGFTPVIPTPFVVLCIFCGNALIILILLVLIGIGLLYQKLVFGGRRQADGAPERDPVL